MTVAELQEKTRALRMTNPELFERPEPIVKKRFVFPSLSGPNVWVLGEVGRSELGSCYVGV